MAYGDIEMKEDLSAFMDGELSGQEQERVTALLVENAELKASWERYHLIRAAMRNEVIGVSAGLADRIAAQLRSEPAVLAPQRRNPTREKVLRFAGSLAIAASVAAVAVVGVQFLQTGPVIDGASTQPLAQAPVVPQEHIDSAQRHAAAGQSSPESELNLYMVEHNEFSPSSSIKGMMSYGRVVSYENER